MGNTPFFAARVKHWFADDQRPENHFQTDFDDSPNYRDTADNCPCDLRPFPGKLKRDSDIILLFPSICCNSRMVTNNLTCAPSDIQTVNRLS